MRCPTELCTNNNRKRRNQIREGHVPARTEREEKIRGISWERNPGFGTFPAVAVGQTAGGED